MSDVAPEGRFYVDEGGEVNEAFGDGSNLWLDEAEVVQRLNRHDAEIRSAVEAERERCAERCESGGMVNGGYFAAAIRGAKP